MENHTFRHESVFPAKPDKKKHRPHGPASAKTVLPVRDQGLEPWTP